MHIKVTAVRIVPSDDERVSAYASIAIDDSFVVHGLRVKISNKGDYFLFMPGRRQAHGTYMDIVLPINNETRRMIEEKAFAAYQVIADERVKRRVLK